MYAINNDILSTSKKMLKECHHSKGNTRCNTIHDGAIAKVIGLEKSGQVQEHRFWATPTQ